MTSGPRPSLCAPQPVTDADIYAAMQEAGGYIDITPGDFKEVYRLAFDHAVERIRQAVRAGDIMTSPVHSVTVATPLAEVARLMAKEGVSGVPVTDNGRVAGIISEKDFLAHMGAGDNTTFMAVVADCLGTRRCAAVGVRGRTAADIMTGPAITVSVETPFAAIAELMTGHAINRLPVTDAAGRPVGIVSRADLIAATSPPAR